MRAAPVTVRHLRRVGVGAVLALGLVVGALLLARTPSNSPSLELTARVPYAMGGDLQFQRRSGPHLIDGATVNTPTDIAFASAHADVSRIDGGIEIMDVTNPRAPKTLARIPCPGYQSDVAVYQTLLLQTLDHRRSNVGCDPDWLRATGSDGVDQAGIGGVRIYDVTDPARPKLVHFLPVLGAFGDGVHDVTVLPWAGIAYLARLDGQLGIIDLNDPGFAATTVDVIDISPEMKTSCHDIGLDPVRQLAFCPAMEAETYILDVRDPKHPAYVGKIVNAALSRHHGALMAPDGQTLVLQSEFDHPAQVASGAPAGLWFYDLRDPAKPVALGSWAPSSCEPSEQAERACSSHWFNFIPGTKRLVASWRQEGIFVVDFADPSVPVEALQFRPGSGLNGLTSTQTDFWSAYFWHGYVYGSANRAEGGLYVLGGASITDFEPSPYDEGTSWGRWQMPAASTGE